ncbi:hypothetical protein ACFQO4_14980 [Saliphagus sp. GCM10025334]
MSETNETSETNKTSEIGDEIDIEADDLESVVETGSAALTALEDHLADVDALGELDDDALEDVRQNLDALEDVTTALAEFIEAMDLEDLAEVVEPRELLEAIDVGEIPDALQSGEIADAVNVTALLDALNLLEAWGATDVTDVLREGDDLTDTLEDVSEEDSAVGAAASTVTDDDGDDEDDFLEDELDVSAEETMDALDVDVLEDPEYVQVSIQQAAMEAIDGVRWTLLETHEHFEKLYEFNRERMRRQDRGTTSRNPTAASTMPVARADLGSDNRYSTVPQQVKLSTAPARRRIYGRRFEIERERQRGER